MSEKIKRNTELYSIEKWGHNFFGINPKGNVFCRHSPGKLVDLHSLIQKLTSQGISPPLLLKFEGIIHERIEEIYTAFADAMQQNRYRGGYQLVYPIKVNPIKEVVLAIQKARKNQILGLEVGSKSELIAALSIPQKAESVMVCNGYKDAEYVEWALRAKKRGHQTILVVEQLGELSLIDQISRKLNIRAEIGLRIKLHTKSRGIWSSSGGDFAKFGLSTGEVIAALQKIKQLGLESCVTLMHFHIGSQILSLKCIEQAIEEAMHYFVEIAKSCPHLHFFDVGGGLAVDYQGTAKACDFSADYTVQEYAKTIVQKVQRECDRARISHPKILSESGRAITAHHSVLITEVLSSNCRREKTPAKSIHHPLLEKLERLHRQNYSPKVLKNAEKLYGEIYEAFLNRKITLLEKRDADLFYQQILAKACDQLNPQDPLHQEFAENYLCNFSLFQSLPDVWAIKQLFPVMPIHRLQEEPTTRAKIVDLCCDSDGKIDRFIVKGEVIPFIPLHPLNANPYYIGIFLVGAYQEVMGDHHNLFGKTNSVHIDLQGNYHVIEGDTISDMLEYVNYRPGKKKTFPLVTSYLENS
jgi:arginine decarboxylase